MTYFFDANTSRPIVHALLAFHIDARHLLDSDFPANIPDAELIPAIAALGWVFITADAAIRKKPPEREAIERSGVTAIFLPRKFHGQDLFAQAEWFMKHWKRIAAEIEAPRHWRTAYLTMDGKLNPFDPF